MITTIKRNSAALIDEAEKGLADLENGLILWYRRPGAAKKQFKNEIGYLRMDAGALDRDLIARQRQWQAEHDGRAAAPAAAPAPSVATPFGDVSPALPLLRAGRDAAHQHRRPHRPHPGRSARVLMHPGFAPTGLR